LTYKQIEEDGFIIDEKVENLLSADTDTAISKSIGLGIISYTDALSRLNPDLLIVLGDRYETFAAVIAAYTMKIPVAHLHGGELTKGLIDEGIRHSITKMSYLHFTSTEEYRKRVIQLGESPDRVFNVGAIGLDNIKNMDFLSKEELQDDLEIDLDKKQILLTYHPVTLDKKSSEKQFKEIIGVINELKDYNFVITKPNADNDGRIIIKMIDELEKENSRVKAFTSLGSLKYLSLLNYVDMVIGNSSSGIIEVPSFNIPTINIGDRQGGRFKPASVINTNCNTKDIINSIKKAENIELNNYDNPYGKGNTSNKIMKIIKKTFNSKIDIKKDFYDIDYEV
jgi:UDP-hydrolysing UDP-N-acetyl-D-glucosamine 2-epimerase